MVRLLGSDTIFISQGPGLVYLLGMIVLSVSIMSFLISACVSKTKSKQKKKDSDFPSGGGVDDFGIDNRYDPRTHSHGSFSGVDGNTVTIVRDENRDEDEASAANMLVAQIQYLKI
ncbi:hypothetical protein OROHE_009131 [Orobanche hederae]